jgi:CBS domain containing-hemolysin-like protein
MLIPLLLLLTVVGSALFAGLETGMVSLNRVRLRVRARRGDASAQTMLRFLQRPERFLAAFLVGNTLCNVGGGALASYWIIESLQDETLGSVVATLGMSAIFLVFSEVGPKTYFRIRAERAVPKFLWFIYGASWLFAPVVWVTSGLFRLVTGGSGRSPFVTREELRQLVREAEGRLGVRGRRMLQSVFDFGQTVVREIMIPLPEVISLPENAGSEDLLQVLRQHRYTRIPVYRNRVDAIVGLVNVFDVLYDPEPGRQVSKYRRPIHIVPETSRINRVLVELQRRRESMALVVNEYGACIGIVTVEDIVEEIVGELVEEHEEIPRPIQRVGDGFVIQATLDIDDLNEELRLSLRKDRVDTVGGLVLRRLGRIPQVGERVRLGNVEIEVLTVHAYGLKRLKVRVLEGGQGTP